MNPSDKIYQLWQERGFKEPTDVQKQAYGPISSGKNVLIVAPTGSGKTEAALLPVLERILSNNAEPISVLYITPLRALNRDMLDRIKWWGEALGLRVDVRHGDTSQYRRSKQASEPPHILITTPETLQAILPAQKMGEHLKNVQTVIIDEIHELVGEKRGYQLAIALERLEEKIGHSFQRVGISATVGSPKLTARFLAGSERTAEIIDVSAKKEYSVRVLYPRPNAEDKKAAAEMGMNPDVYIRLKAMSEILKKHKQVITFVNTRNMAEHLSLYFSAFHDSTDVHHSSLSRSVRLNVEETFKRGEIKHLIATSSMELGIDVGEVDAVIQYGSPRQVTRLIQRVGRAGHRYDRVSIGYIIALDANDFVEAAIIAKRAKEKRLEPARQETNALDVLAHQIVGILMDWGEMRLEDAYRIVKRAQPYETLEESEFMDVVTQLESERFLRVVGDRIRRTRDTWRYYYGNLSMIPDNEKFLVIDVVSSNRIASLDEDFVSTYLGTGTVFVVKGRPWRVISIEDQKVYVEPSESVVGAIPSWIGEMIPVEEEVAREVAAERRRMRDGTASVTDIASISDISAAAEQFRDAPSENTVRIEESERFVVIHVPLGSRGNATLGRILAAEITRRYGLPVRMFSSPYAIILEFESEGFGAESVAQILRSINPELADLVLENAITKTNMFKWRFIHVARRFGLISKHAKLEKINVRKLLDALVGSPIHREAWKEILHEKLDLDAVKRFLRDLEAGKYSVETRKEISKVGKYELSHALNAPELVNPDTPEHTILDLFKKRVLEKEVTLLCTSCGTHFRRKVKDVADRPKCIRCGSPMVAVVHDPEDAWKILQKKRPSKKDQTRIMELIRNAELVGEFGKRAIITMAVPGIGSQTAARILRVPYQNDDEFWKALLDAERTYFRTKMFWKK
ncbi:MAG: DEAD/DEAH box helicase [Candidatus Diapherotrites archaeon]|nr:DEAD/DEAH box helicase [Candidatus Diapherotrites archaeon]